MRWDSLLDRIIGVALRRVGVVHGGPRMRRRISGLKFFSGFLPVDGEIFEYRSIQILVVEMCFLIDLGVASGDVVRFKVFRRLWGRIRGGREGSWVHDDGNQKKSRNGVVNHERDDENGKGVVKS
jgi:hypothetical protein